MREIEFRGLTKSCGIEIWVEGYLIRQQFGAFDRNHYPEYDNKEYLEYETLEHLGKQEIICYGYQILNKNGHSYSWVKIKSIGQYTGLKDKNGKKIYEGNILSVNYEIVTSRYEVIIDKGHTIVKHPEYKVGERPLMFYLSDDNTQLYEVIDNIYENPELLESNND